MKLRVNRGVNNVITKAVARSSFWRLVANQLSKHSSDNAHSSLEF